MERRRFISAEIGRLRTGGSGGEEDDCSVGDDDEGGGVLSTSITVAVDIDVCC